MRCIFYYNQSDKNVMEKVLTNAYNVDIVFLESTDFTHPKITVTEIPENANYCFIAELNRYYFFDSVKVVRNNLFDVYLSCDVLSTYKDDIKSSIAEIIESENILDENKIDYSAENVETKIETPFVSPFTGSSDILITAQGGIA